jgi:hypothetical protein
VRQLAKRVAASVRPIAGRVCAKKSTNRARAWKTFGCPGVGVLQASGPLSSRKTGPTASRADQAERRPLPFAVAKIAVQPDFRPTVTSVDIMGTDAIMVQFEAVERLWLGR